MSLTVSRPTPASTPGIASNTSHAGSGTATGRPTGFSTKGGHRAVHAVIVRSPTRAAFVAAVSEGDVDASGGSRIKGWHRQMPLP